MALSPRILALGALLALLLLAVATHACAAGPAAGREPAPRASSPLPAPEPHLAGAPAAEHAVDVLAAVVVARRVCILVDRRSYAAARWLFADGAQWPAGLWHRMRRVRFRSARVLTVRGGSAPIVRLNVRVATASSRRGLRTLRFTLGRVGTDGDWLVYAVRTPIPPRERGPSCPPLLPAPAGFSPV